MTNVVVKSMMLDWLFVPLGYLFMQRSLLAAAMVGVACAIVGTYIVVQGMAFLGDALAHAMLPGVAIAFITGGADGPLFFGGLASGVLAALGIGTIAQSSRLKTDTVIGVVFAGAFAFGIALISSTQSYSTDLTHILFGNVLGVSVITLRLVLIFGGLVILANILLHKELTIVAFDPIHATSLGLPTRMLRYILLILVAVTTVVALNTVGIALMVAMLVTPPATALQVTNRMPHLMLVASSIGIFSAVVGLYISFYAHIAAGASIVLVATMLFGIVFILTHNPLWQRRPFR